jgi:ABC-type transport system involved in multi-copper enzyme maturation permease subunit
MTSVWIVAYNTLRQTLRQRLLYNVAIFGIGLVLVSKVIGDLTYGYADRVVRSIGLAGVAISLDLIALLVGVSLIHDEIDRKTLFVVLVRPVSRAQYVVGRYLGLVATLVLTLFGLSAVFIIALISSRGWPVLGDFIALSASIPESAILAGVGLVLSSFSTPTLSAGIGIGVWIAAASTDDFVRLTQKEGGLIHLVARVVYYILPSTARFNFREIAIYDQVVPFADWAGTFAYGVVYCIVLAALASAILNRREMV